MKTRLEKLYTTKAHYEVGLRPEQRDILVCEKRELLINDDAIRSALELGLFHKHIEKELYNARAIKVYREGDCGNFGKRVIALLKSLGNEGMGLYMKDHIITQASDRELGKSFFIDVAGIVNPQQYKNWVRLPADKIDGGMTYIDSVCGNYRRLNNDPMNPWNIYLSKETRGQLPPHRNPNLPLGAKENPSFYEERIQKFITYFTDCYFPEWQFDLRKSQGVKRTIFLSRDMKKKQTEIMDEIQSHYYLGGTRYNC